MKWINKNKGDAKAKADQLVKEFMDTCCLQSDGRYHEVRYDKRDPGTTICFCAAKSGHYRKLFTNLMLENQDGYCCYCMRKIKVRQDEIDSDEVVTREHIIPRGFTMDNQDRVENYYQNCTELSTDEVLLTDRFEDPSYKQKLPPFPHKVAFNNLVASCNGTFPYVRSSNFSKSKICCNEVRHEEDAYPVYYHPDIESMVEYGTDGGIQPCIGINTEMESRISDVIAHARLDCDTLKDIRYLWFVLSHVTKAEIYNCRTSEQRNRLLSDLLYRPDFWKEDNVKLHDNFQKDDFWNTFMLYDYFYDVYSAN